MQGDTQTRFRKIQGMELTIRAFLLKGAKLGDALNLPRWLTQKFFR